MIARFRSSPETGLSHPGPSPPPASTLSQPSGTPNDHKQSPGWETGVPATVIFVVALVNCFSFSNGFLLGSVGVRLINARMPKQALPARWFEPDAPVEGSPQTPSWCSVEVDTPPPVERPLHYLPIFQGWLGNTFFWQRTIKGWG